MNNTIPTIGGFLVATRVYPEWEPSCVTGGDRASSDAARPPPPQLEQFGTDVESIENKV